MSVFIYDVDIVDYTHSYALLNGEFNSDISQDVKIGIEATIEVHSYMSKTEKKLDGNDLFFLAVINRHWDETTNSKSLGR